MSRTYTHLSDEEFLLDMDDKIAYSPVLKEFARRLRSYAEQTTVPADANHRTECPICATELLVDYDEGNMLFNLKVDRDA